MKSNLKVSFSLLNELLPRWSIQSVLEQGDTFSVAVTKHFSVNRIISNAELTPFMLVFDDENLDGVRKNGHTVSLKKSEHHHIIRPTFNSDD